MVKSQVREKIKPKRKFNSKGGGDPRSYLNPWYLVNVFTREEIQKLKVIFG